MPNTIIIIGGGPIGFSQALGLKTLNPNLRIVVFEKYPEYQRHHTLNMQHQNLREWMQAAGLTESETLLALEKRLQNNAHIRTSELENTLKTMALGLGIEVCYEAITQDNIATKLSDYPDTSLIIGADGTHGITNQIFFLPENQVKYEFDYALQCRYDVTKKRTQPLYSAMVQSGRLAHEYTGPRDATTRLLPVTTQVIISKEEYQRLKESAPSKSPLNMEIPLAELREKLGGLSPFLVNYLAEKGQDGVQNLRLSVNELPATQARQVTSTTHRIPVVLIGDAALGLSYFKGLNAGLLASAKLLRELRPAIQNPQKRTLKNRLQQYQQWFLKDFAPQQIRAMEQYSYWRVGIARMVMEAMPPVSSQSLSSVPEDFLPFVAEHIQFTNTRDIDDYLSIDLFPHRKHTPKPQLTLNQAPLEHHGKKLAKLFLDYAKPYKSQYQIWQDFKQPLLGVAHCLYGLFKIVIGLLQRNAAYIGDGIMDLIRGSVEIALTPFTLFLKPIARGLLTLIYGKPLIENSANLQNLATLGLEKLATVLPNETEAPATHTDRTAYELRALCHDLHRKFNKGIQRGQATNLLKIEESSLYEAMGNHPGIQGQSHLKAYYHFFKQASQPQPATTALEPATLNV
ncbi:MAG: hypothetical protein NTU48_09440 [Legionellales bacterium]|nr:hypothetical protein [Legionellales bacterium]